MEMHVSEQERIEYQDIRDNIEKRISRIDFGLFGAGLAGTVTLATLQLYLTPFAFGIALQLTRSRSTLKSALKSARKLADAENHAGAISLLKEYVTESAVNETEK